MAGDHARTFDGPTITEYVMVLYSRAPKEGRVGQADEVFVGHQAFPSEQRELGREMISGPFGDDGLLRGVSIYNSTSLDEVHDWVADDPAVVAGWMTFEVRPWWGIAGSLLAARSDE